MRTWPLTLMLLLASCATIVPHKFVGPNGRTAYAMRCTGEDPFAACYKKAGELCPSGYTVVDRATGTVAVPVYGGGIVAAPRHNLAIECK